MNFRFGELFSGPGGLALGAKLAKICTGGQVFSISHAWATDYDKDSCDTYRNNICPDNPKSVVCCDIRKLNFKKLKDISDIDALAFGFPCNDYSVVGKQKGIFKRRFFMPRANVLEGFTTKIKCGCGSLYVTLNKNEKGELSEVFLNLGKSGTCSKSYMELLGRMMTHAIRKDVDIKKVIKSIKGIQCMQASEVSLSCANAIAHALEIYLQKKEGKES